MQIPDLVNGGFEAAGALMCYFNVRRILRDKAVAGVHWWVQGFFTVWGVWNLYFYPQLDQWFSFAGGVALVLFNGAWVVLAIHYGGLQWRTQFSRLWQSVCGNSRIARMFSRKD